MNDNLSQAFIKTFVRKTLKDIKDDPERSIRNIIDMALNVSKGRFQRNFFEAAQEMLRNESSAYYGLIQDLAQTVNHERILTFGMNVGYTSCTLGAKTIREMEKKLHFNIPWCVSLLTDVEKRPSVLEDYQSVIEQGKELGIHTWLIFEEKKPQGLLPLVKKNPDCAFVLFCHADSFSDEFLTEADTLYNLLFAVRFERAAAEACAALRERNLPSAVYVPYQKEDAGIITSGGLFGSTEAFHPLFTFLVPDASCPIHIQEVIYNYVKNARKAQKYQTIPLDLVYDNWQIDAVISDGPCTAVFDSNGNLMDSFCKTVEPGYNIFQSSLADIFKQAFPKNLVQENPA